MKTKILVTGGAGFIGSHLVEKFSPNENEITVFDNLSTGRKEFLQNVPYRIIQADVQDADAVLNATKGMDEVFHFAGDVNVRRSISEPAASFNTEVLGTFNVLEACRKNDIKKLCYSSSFLVYGNPEIKPPPETAAIHPITNYGAGKAASEAFITSYSELYGINSVVLRYTAVQGPRLLARVVYDLYMKLKADKSELEILGDGMQKRGFIHVSDCVDGTMVARKVAKKPVDFFNVGVAEDDVITIKEIADLIVEMMDLKNVKYKFTGGSVGWKGDVSYLAVSIEKLRKHGWSPKFTVRQSVIDTIDWLMKNA